MTAEEFVDELLRQLDEWKAPEYSQSTLDFITKAVKQARDAFCRHCGKKIDEPGSYHSYTVCCGKTFRIEHLKHD